MALMHAMNATRTSSTHQSSEIVVIENGSSVVSDLKYAKDVASSVILQGLGEVQFACVIQN